MVEFELSHLRTAELMLGINQVLKVNIVGDKHVEHGRLDFWSFASPSVEN